MATKIRTETKLGLFTKLQLLVLKHRSDGLSQAETARKIGTSRANVSMIELRAKRKLARARETLAAYESLLSEHSINVARGTKLHDVPTFVLAEGDKYGVHLRSNLIDIIRMAKRADPDSARDGGLTRDLKFVFAQSGILSLQKIDKPSKS
jgi:HTH-type transcriptional regulator, fmd operon transcriptional regulator